MRKTKGEAQAAASLHAVYCVCERMPRWRPAALEALQNACSVPRYPHGGRMETYISLKATVVTSLSHHSHVRWACIKARHK